MHLFVVCMSVCLSEHQFPALLFDLWNVEVHIAATKSDEKATVKVMVMMIMRLVKNDDEEGDIRTLHWPRWDG